MYQFYLLSIVCNILIAFALAADTLEDKAPAVADCVARLMERKGFPAGLGAAGFVVGVFKVLSVTAGDVVVIGDALPALAGILGGGALFFESREGKAGVGAPAAAFLESLLTKRRTLWGLLALLAAALHFFFPAVLFL